MCNTWNSTACLRRVTMPWWHLVIVFSPLIDTDTSLARQIVIMLLSVSKKQGIKLKMFLVVRCSKLGWRPSADWTGCRWCRSGCACQNTNCYNACCHPRQPKMPWLTNKCSNRFAILFRLVATKVWTYWLMLWSLMSPNFYTLKRLLMWWIMVAVYWNDMLHLM
jgi:hypothetical protein